MRLVSIANVLKAESYAVEYGVVFGKFQVFWAQF